MEKFLLGHLLAGDKLDVVDQKDVALIAVASAKLGDLIEANGCD